MNNNDKAGNNSSGGFLLGVLVGAAIVFLLGTEKGKRILKIISEKGVNNISNMLEEAGRSAGLDEIAEEESEVSLEENLTTKENAEDKPKVKRFFRGISRHLN
jgi:hypothetical protein